VKDNTYKPLTKTPIYGKFLPMKPIYSAPGDKRQATSDKRQATSDKRQATSDKRQANYV
jgi:hypothetical protein